MNSIIFLALSLLTFSVSAAEVDGHIFYKTKSGDLVKRDVVLEVPARGQGEVVLKSKSFEWRTTDFWTTYSPSGEVTFTAAFATEFMGNKSTIALQGTYLKGDNKIVYNGNFYKRKNHEPVNEDISDFKYNGGFSFAYVR